MPKRERMDTLTTSEAALQHSLDHGHLHKDISPLVRNVLEERCGDDSHVTHITFTRYGPGDALCSTCHKPLSVAAEHEIERSCAAQLYLRCPECNKIQDPCNMISKDAQMFFCPEEARKEMEDITRMRKLEDRDGGVEESKDF